MKSVLKQVPVAFLFFPVGNDAVILGHAHLWWSMLVYDEACLYMTKHDCFWWGMLVYDEACLYMTKHDCLWRGILVYDEACLFIMKHASLWWSMLVHDEACLFMMKHSCLWWSTLVHNEAFLFMMKHACSLWGMLVHNEACLHMMRHACLWWSMLVCDEACLFVMWHACITGNRADLGSRMDNSAPPSRMGVSSRLSQVSQQARLEIDEVSLQSVKHNRYKHQYMCPLPIEGPHGATGRFDIDKWTIFTTNRHKRERVVWFKVKAHLNIYIHMHIYVLCIIIQCISTEIYIIYA